MTTALGGTELIAVAARSALDRKAEGIVCIDLRNRPSAADWFVVCEGDNAIHNKAIAEAVLDSLAQQRTRPWHVEGREQGRWILLDYTDVVIHVLLPDLRAYYELETLWEGSPRYGLEDESALDTLGS
ncbi:MAG: ribosome silencing factor [Chitinivibrionales bacterium]|nr:ribosome silencing factor [Chitinivibrionales bacterium]MBD3396028.1 ribosome silencing factor [Chitinivibrionales bacterium]